jgi:hypothetical protein
LLTDAATEVENGIENYGSGVELVIFDIFLISEVHDNEQNEGVLFCCSFCWAKEEFWYLPQ